MSPTSFTRTESQMPDTDIVTWAGPHPHEKGLCLGFEDGSIVFGTLDMSHASHRLVMSDAREAINGIAAIGTSTLAVSTRADVTFVHLEGSANGARAVFPHGAHGVVSTPSGYYFAPLGMQGLLIVKPDTNAEQVMHVTTGTEGLLYFYRMAVLRDTAGKEVLVFANRRGGVGLSEFRADASQRDVHTMRFEGLDVVDVCGIAHNSLSAIAISPKAEVLWIKDASTHNDPLTMRLMGVEGVVYRVLATPRHLFVLSSKAFYVWENLVEKTLFGASVAVSAEPFVLPMDAIDMSLVGDEHLVLVMGDGSFTTIQIQDANQTVSTLSAGLVAFPSSLELSRKTRVEEQSPDWTHAAFAHGQKKAA